ncbi:MAG: hypothetical protein ABFD69_15195 [Candidatus Sumerlaeia bacterium]
MKNQGSGCARLISRLSFWLGLILILSPFAAYGLEYYWLTHHYPVTSEERAYSGTFSILLGFLAIPAGIVLWALGYILKKIIETLERRQRPQEPEIDEPPIEVDPCAPQAFGYKCAWLAIRTGEPEKVVEALGLTEVRPCSWAEGIKVAYIGRVFVSPPVNGWVFAVSFAFPSEPETIAPFLEEVGGHFDEVQYFGTHRVVEYHAWALARAGKIVRAYAYLGERGETLWDVGPKTPGELELGVNFFDERSPEAKDEKYFERTDLAYPDEEYVMQIAGKWSVNPDLLEEMALPPGSGLTGRLPKQFNQISNPR